MIRCENLKCAKMVPFLECFVLFIPEKCGGLLFPQAGRPDNENYLESGELRGDMRAQYNKH